MKLRRRDYLYGIGLLLLMIYGMLQLPLSPHRPVHPMRGAVNQNRRVRKTILDEEAGKK